MQDKNPRFDLYVWQVLPWEAVLDDVLYLEAARIGTVWIGDTFFMPPVYGHFILEAWTTLAALASRTSRVRLGTMITNATLRHPAVLAMQAATVDCISGGRLDLGVGPGENFSEEATSLGLPSLSPGARIDRLHEAVGIIDQLLRGEEVTFHGDYYQVDQAKLATSAVQRPRPPLAIAAQGKKSLRVAAEYADIWVTLPSGKTQEEQLQRIRERNQMLDEHCAALGRDPQTVERACLPGWGGPETPFASENAFSDYVGRFREAGTQRFIFSLGNEVSPSLYQKWMASGAWANRNALEGFAFQMMKEMQGA